MTEYSVQTQMVGAIKAIAMRDYDMADGMAEVFARMMVEAIFSWIDTNKAKRDYFRRLADAYHPSPGTREKR